MNGGLVGLLKYYYKNPLDRPFHHEEEKKEEMKEEEKKEEENPM